MLMWIGALFVGLFGYLAVQVYNRSRYWKEKGVSGPTSLIPIVGNFIAIAQNGQGAFDQKWIRRAGRVFGYFDGATPVVIISDTEMLKNIMVKDFSHFVNRRPNELSGEILDQAVSVLKDQRWKDVRSVLVPTFTSGKMRQMNNIINECVDITVVNVAKLAESGEEFEAKKLYGSVTMDVIASTFFGTKVDSQNDPDNLFVKNAHKAFDFSFFNPAIILAFLYPKIIPLFRKVGINMLDQGPINFFIKNTEEIIKLRLESNQGRKDFLQLMLNSLKGKDVSKLAHQKFKETTEVRETADDADVLSDVLSNGGSGEKERVHEHSDYKMSTEEVVAQALIFFLAGYETTATALSFMTYALTIHPEIQDRLRSEIEEVMEGHEKPTYDLIAKMEYLDMCVNETLRLYPPVARTERECNQNWEYNGLTIEKGTIVGIPIFAMQRDPEFWSDPDMFDPERFNYENKQKIKPYTFQTFGQGPRNCIGMRFAYYEMKMVMVSLLRSFRFVQSPRTQVPLILKDMGFIKARDGIWVTVEKLSSE